MDIVKRVQHYVATAQFEEVLQLHREHYDHSPAELQHTLNYFSIISAINVKDVSLAQQYYERYRHTCRPETPRAQMQQLYIEAIMQYALKNEAAGNAAVLQMETLKAAFSSEPYMEQLYAGTFYYKMTYLFQSGQYEATIRLYNQIDPVVMAHFEQHMPSIYICIHLYLISAYIRLKQWYTVDELLRNVKDQCTYLPNELIAHIFSVHHHLMNWLLRAVPLPVEEMKRAITQIQKIPEAIQLICDDVATIQQQKPSRAVGQLYELLMVHC